MKIAVVGATGNIAGPVCRELLAAGHQVRALSRGGKLLDELVSLGAEPFPGSFDEGTPGLDAFFSGADAAFTMVRSDWSNVGHYPDVAARLSRALRASPVSYVVNLSAFGGDLREGGGHSTDFHVLEEALNSVPGARVVHVRGGWFMENFLSLADGVARHGKLASTLHLDIELPCVAIHDISRAIAQQLLSPASASRSVCEVQGPEDLTMADAARLIAEVIGRPLEAKFISLESPEVKEEYKRRGESVEAWQYACASDRAFNDRRVRFHQPRSQFDRESMTFGAFLRQTWLPRYQAAVAGKDARPESLNAWLAGRA